MSRIQILPTAVIELIAAGEVAESPTLIIKELIENSLDAGATNILIELEKSGLNLIRVTDNGCGIVKTDLTLAVQRHTTSKISSVTDLENIHSLGFRGEALASMVQVSHLRLSSRTPASEYGFEITATADQISVPQAVTHRLGTVVTLTQLFDSVPVRKKFLKTPNKELQSILSCLTAFGLCYPGVTFSVIHDQELVMKLNSTDSVEARIEELFSIDQQQLLPITDTLPQGQLTGIVGTPQLAQKQSPQFIFVNGRLLVLPRLQKKIRVAYGTLIEKSHQPFFVLSLQLNPHDIDIHVHPHKETARFNREVELFDSVAEAIHKNLSTSDLAYAHSTEPAIVNAKPLTRQLYPSFKKDLLSSSLHQLLKTWQPGKETLEILQVQNTYLVCETPTGFIMLDQHAVHERILYEQFKAELNQQHNLQQRFELLSPLTLKLSQVEKHFLKANQDWLDQVGLEIEEFGNHSHRLVAVPQILATLGSEELVDFIHEALAQEEETPLSELTHALLARLACRSAVKAGDPLSQTQRFDLLHKIAQTPNQFTCPHGRPTMITYSTLELEKMFKRQK